MLHELMWWHTLARYLAARYVLALRLPAARLPEVLEFGAGVGQVGSLRELWVSSDLADISSSLLGSSAWRLGSGSYRPIYRPETSLLPSGGFDVITAHGCIRTFERSRRSSRETLESLIIQAASSLPGSPQRRMRTPQHNARDFEPTFERMRGSASSRSAR